MSSLIDRVLLTVLLVILAGLAAHVLSLTVSAVLTAAMTPHRRHAGPRFEGTRPARGRMMDNYSIWKTRAPLRLSAIHVAVLISLSACATGVAGPTLITNGGRPLQAVAYAKKVMRDAKGIHRA